MLSTINTKEDFHKDCKAFTCRCIESNTPYSLSCYWIAKVFEHNKKIKGEKMDNVDVLEYENKKKNVLIAYLLWWFLGYFGAHRIYAHRPFVLFLSLWAVTFVLYFFVVGVIFAIPMCIWTLIDGIFLYKWIQNYNIQLLEKYKNTSKEK